MARNVETREIDGVSFKIHPLGFTAGRKLFVRLSKALGPTLATAAAGAKDLASLDLAAVVRAAVESLEDADLEYAAEVLGEVTQFSTDRKAWPYLTRDNREEFFAGRILLFFKWIAAACDVQFSDFSDALGRVRRDPAPEGGTPPGSRT